MLKIIDLSKWDLKYYSKLCVLESTYSCPKMVRGWGLSSSFGDRGKEVRLKISETWWFLRPSSPFFSPEAKCAATKQKLVPSIDMLTETEPLFPKYPMMPQATEQTFTFEMQYFLSNSLLIHTLISTPTIFLLAMSLYLLPQYNFSLWVLHHSFFGVLARLLRLLSISVSKR